MLILVLPGAASAGKLSWLDDLVQDVILEAKAGGKGLVRGGDGARTEIRGVGRLFVTHEADETLEPLVRRSDELARAGRRVEQPAEALLQARFSRLLKQDKQTLRVFEALKLQPRILRVLFTLVILQGSRIGAREAGFHFVAAIGRVDEHEPPGLAVADRGRVARKFKQRMHQLRIDRITAKAANVAAPEHQVDFCAFTARTSRCNARWTRCAIIASLDDSS